jgi:hypothetical protein
MAVGGAGGSSSTPSPGGDGSPPVGMAGSVSASPSPPSIPEPSPGAEEAGCPVTFNRSLEVHSQAELEALRGCSNIDGDLVIYPFDAAVDLSPLAALTRVGGRLALGDPFEEPPAPSFTSLAGLESLRSVGGLSLRGVTARSLEPLSGLAELSVSTGSFPGDGLVMIENCPELTSLQGLENMEGLRAFVAKQNRNLVSIAGLRVPAELAQFEIWDSPVVDIDALAPLTIARFALWFINTGLTGASPLARLSHVGDLQFSRNVALTDLSALSTLPSVFYLAITDNPSLATLPSFPELAGVEVINIASNSSLNELGEFPALQRVHDVSIVGNPLLKRVAALSLESATRIEVSYNAVLDQLDLGRLMSVESLLRVVHNPLLDSASVPRPAGGTIVVGGNRGDALGLDPCPWSGNTFCEASRLDDLCALGTDSDCPSGEPL